MIDGKPPIFISYSEAFKEKVAIPFRNFVESLDLHGILVGEEPAPEGKNWDPETKVHHYLDVATMFVALATPDTTSESGDVFTRPNIVDEIRAARERPHLKNRIQIFKASEVSLPSNINPTHDPLDVDKVDSVFPLFERQARMYGILRPAAAAGGPTEPPATDPAASSVAPDVDADGEQEAATALRDLAALLLGGDIEEPSAVAARAYLAASAALAARRTADPPGVHECNSLYLERNKLNLSSEERGHLLRAILANITSDNAPGWYWLRELNAEEVQDRVVQIAIGDSDDDARTGAIQLLTEAPEYPGTARLRTVIKSGLNSDGGRIGSKVLGLLGRHGKRTDLRALGTVLDDYRDQEEVAKARLTIQCRESPRTAMRAILKNGGLLDDTIADMLVAQATSIAHTNVITALSAEEQDVRKLALRLLDSTSKLRKSQVEQLIEEDGSPLVKAKAAELALKRGWKLSEEKLDNALKDLEWEFDLEERLYFDFFSRLPVEELRAGLFWHGIRGYRIYEALSRRHFDEVRDHIDTDLDDDFARLKHRSVEYFSKIVEHQVRAEIAKKYGGTALDSEEVSRKIDEEVKNLMGDDKVAKFILRKFRAAALAGLAENGDMDHLRHAFRFLGSGPRDLQMLCLKLIRRAGGEQEVPRLLDVARGQRGEIRELAAKAALDLSSDRLATAKLLLEIDDVAVISIALEGLDDAEERDVVEMLFGLLRNNALGVRNVVTKYLIRRLSQRPLRMLPNIYARGQYYYSVQVLVDRALYAPRWVQEALSSR